MEIDANMNWGAVNGVPAGKPSVGVPKSITQSDSFTNSSSLEGALNNTPDVRPDVVANARSLVNDNRYPGNDTVKSLSNFLATKLQSGQD